MFTVLQQNSLDRILAVRLQFLQGFIVNGVVNVIIPALEKRCNLSSQRSAIIASGNDFGAFIFFVFVGYIGERVQKPKLMAAGVLGVSLGSVFSFATFHWRKIPLHPVR